jgi:hypothetical protein
VEQIQNMLEAKGPIIFSMRAGTAEHCSVIIGVIGNLVIYHDPWSRHNQGKWKRMHIGRFNHTRTFKTGVYGLLQRAHIRDCDVLTIRRKTVGRSVGSLRAKFGN